MTRSHHMDWSTPRGYERGGRGALRQRGLPRRNGLEAEMSFSSTGAGAILTIAGPGAAVGPGGSRHVSLGLLLHWVLYDETDATTGAQGRLGGGHDGLGGHHAASVCTVGQ